MKTIVLFLLAVNCFAQPRIYSMANAHSHNDYQQKRPFLAAYELNFGSIEADLYVKNGELFVAHDEKDIKPDRTFEKMYLLPLLEKITENNGFAYANHRPLQLLLDLKKNGVEIMDVLEKQLLPHKKALKNIKFVISGDMPPPENFEKYNKMFSFDGRRNVNYSEKAFKRVAFVSESFLDFGKFWTGKEPLPNETFQKIKIFVDEMHAKGKGVRLWGTPSTPLAFETLSKLDVDFIGTDDLQALADFVRSQMKPKY